MRYLRQHLYRMISAADKFCQYNEEENHHVQQNNCQKKVIGSEKLPTVKSLQAEYAALLAEKKTAYAAYREARGEMKELLTVKANVDRILGKDGQKPERDSTRQTVVGEH